ncbi:MAG: peptidoglycan-associated lipoprotein Pal [Deltaproteobacteria bacterium]|nr:MAG: peptidoglycan-associated lipoprotein Pal [Deltaproteobacteria bacterium]
MKTARLFTLASVLFAALALSGCKPPWPKCENDDQCKERDGQEMNYVCVNGTCKECGQDGDCQEGFVCRDNACVPKPECYTNADCTGGLVCRNEKCVPECTASSDCAEGMKCEGNRCVPDVDCTSDADCAEGEECTPDGRCVAATPDCTVETVYFDFDSSDLTPEARSILQSNAECLNALGQNVVLEGHCDERGTEEYNLQLGERRANAVKKYLVSLGVDPSRIKTVSYGEERPADPGHDEAAWARNRRVEFVLSGPGT